MMSKQQKFGLRWELWTLEQLLNQGWDARIVSNFYADVDIMIGNLPVEVKASRPRQHRAGGVLRTRYQFDVDRLPKCDSLVILIAIAQGQPHPFIVPSWLIGFGRHNVHITSHPTKYRGYFAQFLNAWSNVDTVLSIHAQYSGQMFLPLGIGDNTQISLDGDRFSDPPGSKSLCPHPH